MRKLFHLPFLILGLAACTGEPPQKHITRQPAPDTFLDFINKFSADSSFQAKHINFPVPWVINASNGRPRLDSVVTAGRWLYDGLYYDRACTEKVNGVVYDRNCSDYSPQVYDSFSMEMRDTGERVFAKHGLGSGFEQLFFFQRKGSEWWLVKVVDNSE